MSLERLTDVELLAKLIGVRESRRIYQGALRPLFLAGCSAAPGNERCSVARELLLRALREEMNSQSVLSSPSAVRDYLQITLASREHETFVILLLDAQNRVLAVEELFRGTLTQTAVYPREIIKTALRANAAAVIFAHNHPSGVAEPSRADEALTQTLKHSLALVDVKVLDHFVVGRSGVLSFAERGLL